MFITLQQALMQKRFLFISVFDYLKFIEICLPDYD